jgi:hypothetical protein
MRYASVPSAVVAKATLVTTRARARKANQCPCVLRSLPSACSSLSWLVDPRALRETAREAPRARAAAAREAVGPSEVRADRRRVVAAQECRVAARAVRRAAWGVLRALRGEVARARLEAVPEALPVRPAAAREAAQRGAARAPRVRRLATPALRARAALPVRAVLPAPAVAGARVARAALSARGSRYATTSRRPGRRLRRRGPCSLVTAGRARPPTWRSTRRSATAVLTR